MKNSFENLKVALVYDWADTNYGGAEKVLLALRELFPQAVLFTSIIDYQKALWANNFVQVQTSWLQNWPAWVKKNRMLSALLLPAAFESFCFDDYDLVISVSSFAAKGIITKPHTLHVCYLLTPPRFLYSHSDVYLKKKQTLVKPVLNYLKKWDQVAIYRPDEIIPISNLVSARIKKYYAVDYLPTIYPPFMGKEVRETQKDDYFLSVCRLTEYKRVDLAILACIKAQVPLKVVGTGLMKKKYQKLVKKHHGADLIQFLDQVSDTELEVLYNKAVALLFIGEEDFGITALEANAHHTLVIGNKLSGAMEILPEASAIKLDKPTINKICEAVTKVTTQPELLKVVQIATKYDKNNFVKNFKQQIEVLLEKRKT